MNIIWINRPMIQSEELGQRRSTWGVLRKRGGVPFSLWSITWPPCWANSSVVAARTWPDSANGVQRSFSFLFFSLLSRFPFSIPLFFFFFATQNYYFGVFSSSCVANWVEGEDGEKAGWGGRGGGWRGWVGLVEVGIKKYIGDEGVERADEKLSPLLAWLIL